MDKDLIRAILKYVEETVIMVDGEWGECREDFSELEKDEDVEIPAFYYTLKNMLGELK